MADFQSQVVEFTPIQGMSPIQNSNTGEDSDSCDDMKGPNNNKFNRTSDFNNNNHNHFNTSSTYGGITTNTGYGGITNISRPKGLDGVIEQDNNNTYSNQNQMGTSSVTGGKVKRTFKSSADLNVGGPVMNNLTNDFGNPSSLSNSPNTVTTVEINSGSIGVNPQSQTNSPPRPGGFGGVELPSKKSIKAMKLDAERKAAQQGGIGGGGFNSSFGGPGGPNVGMNTFNQNNQQSYGINMAMQNGPIMQQQDSFNTTAAAATGGGIVDFSGNTNYQNNQFSATGTSTPAGLGSGSTGGGGGFGALPSSPPRPGKGGLPSAPSGGSVDMATYDSSNNNNNNNIGSSPPRPTFGGGGGGGSVLSVEGSMMGPTNQYGDNSNHNGIGSGGSSPLNYQQQQQYQQQGGMVMGNGFNQDNIMSMNNNQQLPFPSASGFNNNSLPAGPGAPGPAKTNTLVENDMRVVDDDDSDSDDNPLSPQEQMMIQQAHQLGADQQSLQQQMQMQQQQGQNLTSQMDNSPGLAVPNPLQQVQPDDVNNLTNDISSTNINVNSTADMSSSTASQTLGVGQNPQFGPSVPPPVPDANNTASAQPSGTTTQGKKSKKPLPPLHAAQPLTIPTDRFAASLRFRKDFVLQPIPYNDRSRTLQARVVRVKEGLSGRMFPTYHLCVRNGPGQDETILLAAQKQTARKTLSGYYLITLDPRCFVKKSSTYVGKLRSNWTGTEYTLYSEGDNPKKSLKLLGGLSMPGFGRNSTNNAQQQAQAAAAAAAQQQQQQQQYLQHQNSMGMNANGMQQQQMAGTYDANGNYIPNGSPGLPPESPMDPNISEVREEMLAIKFSKPGNAPRRMVCVIPGPSVMNPYQRQVFRSKPYQSLMDYANGKENIVSSDGQGIQFMRFVSKSPVWDSRRQTFTINFYGKVRQPSSKNFQLMECDVRALQPNAHRDFIDAQQQQIQQQMAAAQAAQQAQAQQQQQQAMQQQGSQGNNNQMQQNNNLPQSQTQQQQVLSNGGPSVTGSTTGQGLNANSNGTVAGSTTNPMAATNNPISNPPPIPMMVGSQGPGVTDENPVVQFGRWTDEIFNLDGMWPFSIAQVFALALSTFDTRLQETLKMTY